MLEKLKVTDGAMEASRQLTGEPEMDLPDDYYEIGAKVIQWFAVRPIEIQRDGWKAEAEELREVGRALLKFIDSPEVHAEASMATVRGYACDPEVSRRNADTIKSARGVLQAERQAEERDGD